MGLGFDRPWRLKSWDKFAVPRPFSRARGVVGPQIFIPANLDRGELQLRRQGVERLLNQLTAEAEAWAASGRRRTGEAPIRRQGRILGPLGEWSGHAAARDFALPYRLAG
jgi:hypothetical protein